MAPKDFNGFCPYFYTLIPPTLKCPLYYPHLPLKSGHAFKTVVLSSYSTQYLLHKLGLLRLFFCHGISLFNTNPQWNIIDEDDIDNEIGILWRGSNPHHTTVNKKLSNSIPSIKKINGWYISSTVDRFYQLLIGIPINSW